MLKSYKKNVYGYWVFDDNIPLSCDIKEDDLIYAYKVKEDMVFALNEKNKTVSFHITNITKDYFSRLSESFEYDKDRFKKFKKLVGIFKRAKNEL